MREVSRKMAEKIRPYEDYIFEEYWFNNRSFNDIANELGFASGVCLYRYMKQYSFVRTHEEQLQKELKEYVESSGRKIVFIWEHEINDEWFWIGDYLKEYM